MFASIQTITANDAKALDAEQFSERPIQITWKLKHALPGDVFTEYRAAVV